MRIAYVETIGGVAGNMLIGAFLDANMPVANLEAPLRTIVSSGWQMNTHRATRCGIAATLVEVSIDESAGINRSLADILRLLDGSRLPPRAKARAQQTYQKLAHAEAKAHGASVETLHFHEVGALDAIIDIAAVCIAFDFLRIDKLFCSPLPIGGGLVRMRHGNYPNPPPATAELLRGIPTYSVPIDAEMITPTGVALMSTLAEGFGVRPPMTADSIGYGAGSAEFERPNVTRITIGDSVITEEQATDELTEIAVIEANIDDMSPQLYELAMERLFEAGARDAWLTPIFMKKSRPAVTLSAICSLKDEETVAHVMLRDTSTIGVRVRTERKYIMDREILVEETEFGPVRFKRSRLKQTVRKSAEYEDVVRIARATGLPIVEVLSRL